MPIVQGAVYDAVNAIDGGYELYLDGLPPARANASKAAAVARAAHDTLVAIMNQVPTTATFTAAVRAAIITRLDALLADSLAAATAVDGSSAVAAGVAAGDAAADAMLASGPATVGIRAPARASRSAWALRLGSGGPRAE